VLGLQPFAVAFSTPMIEELDRRAPDPLECPQMAAPRAVRDGRRPQPAVPA